MSQPFQRTEYSEGDTDERNFNTYGPQSDNHDIVKQNVYK